MVAPRAQSWIKNGATWLIPALVIFASFLCPVSSHATLFDWDAAYGTWTAGAPAVGATATQAYDITGDGINDVTISISNSASNPSSGGGKFQWVGGYPTVDSTSLTGGLSPAQKALQLQVNQGNPNGVTSRSPSPLLSRMLRSHSGTSTRQPARSSTKSRTSPASPAVARSSRRFPSQAPARTR